MPDTLLRQWMMLRQLPRQPRKIDTAKLAEVLSDARFAVSRRSIERDLMKLSSVFPLCCGDKHKPYGWSWMAGAAGFELSGMDVHAALAFRMAEAHLRPLLPEVTRSYLNPHFQRAKAVLDGLEENELSIEHLFSPAQPPTLALSDFSHLSKDLALLLPMLTVACRDRTVGFDALVWGPPGTGKTELARVIAQEVGARLYEVNVSDDDGDSLKGSRRVEEWTLSQRMLGHKSASLVLFDEGEDVFPRSGLAEMFGLEPETAICKGWMNKALETHAVPTIWISNSTAQIDRAYLRRFDVVVEVRPPPASIRRGMLARHLGQLAISSGWLDRMASDDRLLPAHIERAARAVRMAAPNGEAATQAALDRLLAPQLDRVGVRQDAGNMACGAYDLTLVNASHDVSALTAALTLRPRGTLCLYGPPGTGKTAFVQQLSTLTGIPLLQKRASDLLGKYVGENEKAIASMFRQTCDERKILFLDEADTILQDRSRAKQQWEVSIVNELLQQMEGFQGLFICATNLVDTLDRASLRRFSLKIRFDPLNPTQRWQMLDQTLRQLGAMLPDAAETLRAQLDRLDSVTAGDFAAVARQVAMMGGVATADALVAALQEEVSLKGGTTRKSAGFW